MSEQMQTVLILDDDEVVRESLVGFFEDREWRVMPAETAEKALEMLQQELPDCAIVDIRLPGMDGNMLIRKVSKMYPTLACVICTGSPEYHPPDDVGALAQVSEQIIAKPVTDLAALEKAVCLQIKKCGGKKNDCG